MQFEFQDNKFFLTDKNENIIAEITFPLICDDTVDICHTFVTPCMRGQTIASDLVMATADFIRQNNLKAVVSCSYAKKWFKEHPDQADILTDI